MSTLKKLLTVFGRLPLLFIVDSILKGTFMDFTDFPLEPLSGTFQPTVTQMALGPSHYSDIFRLLFWYALFSIVTLSSVILICSPIESLLEVYGCCLGFGLLIFSHHCNERLVQGTSQKSLASQRKSTNNSYVAEEHIFPMHKIHASSIIVNIVTQLFIVLAFDQICIIGTLHRSKLLAKYARYPTDIFLFLSFTLPSSLHSLLGSDNILCRKSAKLAVIFPLILLLIHTFFVILTILSIVIPVFKNARANIRELGFDVIIIRIMEKANLSWLLRTFFFTKVVYQVLTSKVLSDASDFGVMNWSETVSAWKLLTLEILHNMCGTILSVMSMASIVSIISGWCLNIVYKIIGAQDEEESLQPAVSGFLFVLLAMQTGITSISNDTRLQLLFQNCILLVVANQHFIQTVAADLVLKASTDDIAIEKHVRPMLPYILFFAFPFCVVVHLWEYPFRVSWLLAISAFSLELIIKSVATLTIYTLNMLQSHTNYLHDNIDDILFYVKAVCGCLEFACGIFLFFNGAYIFIFESGGIIRLVMMIIHFYCNIYQTALKGLATYKLRQSSWEKVNRLQPASQEQLDENDDICPICYQEMTEAVVIRCSHVFHRNCLQKWLSIQEKCPLCHVDLTEDSSPNVNRTLEVVQHDR